MFAPTNAAFRALPAGALDKLLANPEDLKKLLLTHVVSGTVYSRGLSSGAVSVLSGGTVAVSVTASMFHSSISLMLFHSKINKCVFVFFLSEAVYIGNAKVIDTDLSASNGIVHVIDQVILQRNVEQPPAAQQYY